jgi:NAD(P)-dependent dehydrogenase (short-subunit alcohol dehydrogenase family)
MVAQMVETYGRIDCAFNNAGIEGATNATVNCTESRPCRHSRKGLGLNIGLNRKRSNQIAGS